MDSYEVIMFVAIIVGACMLWFRGEFVSRITEFFGKKYSLSANTETIIGIVLIVIALYYMKKYTNYLSFSKYKI